MNPDIYREIKCRILLLEYAPGQILNENVLAGKFGVSRTPMREVLYRLSREQLVRVIPRTGIMVTQIEFQTMMYTYQTRLGIEGEVGRRCAELATDDHLDPGRHGDGLRAVRIPGAPFRPHPRQVAGSAWQG